MNLAIKFRHLLGTALMLFGILLLSVKLASANTAVESLPTAMILELESGSKISYNEYGKADGTPVFYFHGFPGSHKDVEIFYHDNNLDELGIRLIALDRQGYSESDPQDDRTLLDWALVVEEVADQLSLDMFSILAYSGGAPFAYSCAYKLPERIEKVMIVSGMTPANAPKAKKGGAMIISKAPKFFLNGMKKMLDTKPEKMEAKMRKGFPEVDRQVYDLPENNGVMISTVKEGMKHSYAGAYQDAIIYKNDWGFELREIQVPVILYHGGQDKNVRVESVRHVIKQLPECTSTIIESEGHLSLIYKYSTDLLSQLK